MGLLVDKDGKPLPDDQQPTLSGWAKHVVMGTPPQGGDIPLTEAPGVAVRAPGAYLKAVGEAVARDTSGKPADGSSQFGSLGENGDHLDPGEPGDRSSHNNDNDVIMAESEFRRPMNASAGARAFFEKEGYSKAPVGGEALYDEAFNQKTGAPGRRRVAEEELADLGAQHKKALADFYGQQTERDVAAAAASKQKAAEDQDELRARQHKLDQATQFYTNDLQDQGKFWTNPGNIMSAIAFSLMPIFSNDGAIGAKLINQAIDRDMAARQHAAGATLGALQSNLSGYHKIAGDRQAGDLLAQAEAHRIAAQEIARIGAQFEGPISQKQMKVNIEDQNTRMAAAQMEFYKANLHVNPSKMDPALHAARFQGPGGYREGIDGPLGGVPGIPPEQRQGTPGNAVTGSIQGTPTTSVAGKDGKSDATIRAVVNTSGMRGVVKADSRGMVNDKNIQDWVKAGMYAEGHALYPNEPPDQAFVKILHQTDEQMKPFSVEISKNATSRVLISQLQGKMALIERLERGEGRDPSDFVSWGRKNMPKSFMNQYDQLFTKDPATAGNKAEERAALRKQAIMAYEAQFQNALNANMHDLNGGAVSAGEAERTEAEVSQAKTWPLQKAFIERKARSLESYVNSNKSGLTPAGLMLYRLRSKGGTLSSGLPRTGQPGPEQAPVAPSDGQVSGGRSYMPQGQSANSSYAGMPSYSDAPGFVGPK